MKEEFLEVEELILKFLREELTQAEKDELQAWKAQSPANRQIFEKLTSDAHLTAELKVFRSFNKEAGRKKLARKIYGGSKLITLSRWKWVAAAVIIMVAGGLWMVLNKKPATKTEQAVLATNDVEAPKSIRAMITLADGRTVALDSLDNGTLAVQNNIRVIKTADGAISYQLPPGVSPLPPGVSRLTYNTLTNPRGSKVIDITLSDGTRVWLNAGSSLKYPVAFIGDERKVEITGEAYFEVAKLTASSYQLKAKSQQRTANNLPFIVSKGNMQVTVLGTHFNVNAYDDEEAIKVTLLEGSVRVAANSEQRTANSEKRSANSVTLSPGQQAIYQAGSEQRPVASKAKQTAKSEQLAVNRSVDLEEVMSWKNGLFLFNGADVQTIMRQVARWYDVEVVYEKNLPRRSFTGKVNRDMNASAVLAMLEYAGIHFKIEGKKITVMN